MTDIDRYITDEAVQAIDAAMFTKNGAAQAALRAALPHIIPAIRADMLREVANLYDDDADVAAIQRVRDLHQPHKTSHGTMCGECYVDEWPCLTISALDGAK